MDPGVMAACFFGQNPGDIEGLRLAVLNALREIIFHQAQSMGVAPQLNATAYFGALLVALDNPDSLQPAHAERTGAMLYLLSIVLPEVPPAIVRHQSGVGAPLLMGVSTALRAEQGVLRPAINCMGVLMLAADNAMWAEHQSIVNMYEGVLTLCIDVRPKICKSAQLVMQKLWEDKGISTMGRVAGPTSKFLGAVMEKGRAASSGDALEQLVQALVLLKMIWAELKPKAIVTLATQVLQLRERQQSNLRLFCLQALDGLFSTMDFDKLPDSTATKLVKAATQWSPMENDLDQVKAYFKLTSSAFQYWMQVAPDQAEGSMLVAVMAVSKFLSNPNQKVSNEAASRLAELVGQCARAASARLGGIDVLPPILEHLTTVLTSLEIGKLIPALSIYQGLFEALGKASLPMLNQVILGVGALRENNNGSGKLDRAVSRVVAAAIKHAGPQPVLELLPLGIDPISGINDASRTWLLPLIKTNVHNGSLLWFGSTLLSLANGLLEGAQRLHEDRYEVAARNMELIAHQLWGLLPAFCREPCDLVQAFPHMAKVLGTRMSTGDEISLTVCLSLATLLEESQDTEKHTVSAAQEAQDALRPFAPNFLPILFNLYMSPQRTQPQLEAAARCIRGYAAIAQEQVVSNFFKSTVEKILTSQAGSMHAGTEAVKMQSELTELALLLVFYLREDAIELLFKVIAPMLVTGEPTLMKKAYKVLRAMAEHHAGFVNAKLPELQEMVSSTAAMCTPTAKKNRIMCLRQIALAVDADMLGNYLAAVMPEVILCTRDSSFKSRESGYEFVVSVGHRLKGGLAGGVSFEDYVTLIAAGLGGRSSSMVAATMMTLSRLVYEFSDALVGVLPPLIQVVCTLLQDNTKEVIKSLVAMIKVMIQSLSTEVFGPHLAQVVSALLPWAASETEGNKNQIRLSVRVLFERLMKKYGFDRVAECVPQEDSKLLINIRKMAERDKRKKMVERKNKRQAVMENAMERHQAFETISGAQAEGEEDMDLDLESGFGRMDQDDDSDEDIEAHIATVEEENRVRKKRSRDDDGDIKVGTDGKLIIQDTFAKKGDESDHDEAMDELAKPTMGIRRAKRARRVEVPVYRHTGTEFRAPKAAGDLQTGEQQPFAYLPMDHRMVNKKKKHKAARSLKAALSKSGTGAKGGKSFASLDKKNKKTGTRKSRR